MGFTRAAVSATHVAPDGLRSRAQSQRRRIIGLAVTTVLLGVMAVASLAIGTETVGLSTVWQALIDYRDIGDQWIVHDLRIPRTVLALVAGMALGVSGALIQAVAHNPLADSQILGINLAQACSWSPRLRCSD